MRHSQSISCAAVLPSAQEHRPAGARAQHSFVRSLPPEGLRGSPGRSGACRRALSSSRSFLPPAPLAPAGCAAVCSYELAQLSRMQRLEQQQRRFNAASGSAGSDSSASSEAPEEVRAQACVRVRLCPCRHACRACAGMCERMPWCGAVRRCVWCPTCVYARVCPSIAKVERCRSKLAPRRWTCLAPPSLARCWSQATTRPCCCCWG